MAVWTITVGYKAGMRWLAGWLDLRGFERGDPCELGLGEWVKFLSHLPEVCKLKDEGKGIPDREIELCKDHRHWGMKQQTPVQVMVRGSVWLLGRAGSWERGDKLHIGKMPGTVPSYLCEGLWCSTHFSIPLGRQYVADCIYNIFVPII